MLLNRKFFVFFLKICFVIFVSTIFVVKSDASERKKQIAKEVYKEIITQSDPIIIESNNDNLENIFTNYYMRHLKANIVKNVRCEKKNLYEYQFIKRKKFYNIY